MPSRLAAFFWYTCVFLLLIVFLAHGEVQECSTNCGEYGTCINGTLCACNENFYGDGITCTSCGDDKISPFGSMESINCTCAQGKVLNRFGECQEECTTEAGISFATTVFDFGLLYSAGCDVLHITKRCCESIVPVTEHHCFERTLSQLEVNIKGNIAPYMYSYIQATEECGYSVDDGKYYHEGCGDGALVGWEHCDDGNDVEGDGCFECWVEDGFSCSERLNQTSVCRVCADICAKLHREICEGDYGACGSCLEGYEEVDGECGMRYQVVYTAVDTPYLANDTRPFWSCEYTPVGSVVETSSHPSASRYLDLVRSNLGHRVAPPEGNCSLHAALKMNSTKDVVVVVELFHDLVTLDDVDLGIFGEWCYVVIFSDGIEPTNITSTDEFMFDVFAGTMLIASHVNFVDVRGHSGGLIRSYSSTVIFEDVSIINATTFDITPDMVTAEKAGIYAFSCEGLTMATYGTLIFRDVRILDSDMFPMEYERACVLYYPHQFTVFGYTEFVDVTVSRNSFSDFITNYGILILKNVEFIDNYAHGAFSPGTIIKSKVGVTFENVTFEGNRVIGALMDLDAPSTLHQLRIVDNEMLGTEPHVRISSTAVLSNSLVHGNTFADETKGVIGIRGSLTAIDNTFSGHEGVRVVVDNTGDATFIRCIFSEYNRAIDNIGTLEIHNSYFFGSEPAIQSDSLVVVYDSVLPFAETMSWIALCNDVVAKSGWQLAPPCGVNSECIQWTSEDDLDGIHCDCGSYTIGDPLVLCSNISVLHVLPEPDVTAYATKSRANQVVTRDRWLLAEGIGQLDWEVVSALPPWLSITPGLTGSFTSDGVCPDNMEEIWFNFHLGHVHRGDNLETVVVFRNFASYDGIFVDNAEYNDDDVAVHVLAHVEVIPSSNTSWVFYDWPCTNDSNPCVVAAGREVSSTIILRDADDYGLGVGGDTFTVESSVDGLLTFSSHDHETGRYTLWFEVPSSGYKENRDFGVRIRLYGNEIQGSPLLFRMECEGDEEWDDGEKKCALDLGIPKTLIAVTMLSIFVVGVFVIRFLKGRALSVQVAALQQEATTILFWCLLDLIDLGTDIGCGVSVYMKESLSAYVPFYFATLTIVIIASGYGFYLRFKVLSQVLRNTFKLRRTSHNGRKLPHPLSVSGITGMTRLEYESDVVLALERIRRDLKSKLYTLAMLFVEDIPMLVLSTIVIMVSSESDQSVIVLISLQSTCIMVGIKLTKITGIWRLLKLSERLYAKLGELNRMHEEPTGRPLKENCFSRPRGQMDKPGAGLRIFTSVHWLYGQDGGANGGVVNWKAEKRNRSSIGLSGYQPKDRGRSK